jgi:PST family polysaccharide transporter
VSGPSPDLAVDPEAPVSSRIDPTITNVRGHAARGTMITAGFTVVFAALGLVQRLVVAAFLTQAEFGLWAVILTIIVTLGWLKQLGIGDKFIQQDEPDQVAAFQKAFTLELAVSVAFFALVALVLPLYALAYGEREVIAGGLVAALAVPLTAFEAAAWIPYRRLNYLRHRVLIAVNPLVTFVATVALAIAGAGYWCFILGAVIGAAASAAACIATCPYPLRLRFDRRTARDYVEFSLPLFGTGLIGLVIVQGSLLAADASAGLAGIGAIGLAVGIAAFADRVDAIVSQTLYPAVCAAVDRTALLYEVFVKSNRLALMWGLPFGVGLALFADDLVRFLFGESWSSATGLIAAIGLTAGLGQVAFNWGVFIRARGDTRPLLVGALGDLAVFLAVSLPAILLLGTTGWAIGVAAAMVVQLCVRWFYLRRLFARFNLLAQLARAAAPVVPGAALVLLARVAIPGDRPLGRAVAELAGYLIVTAALTLLFERALVREVIGYSTSNAPRIQGWMRQK